jgi:hypothetical protein
MKLACMQHIQPLAHARVYLHTYKQVLFFAYLPHLVVAFRQLHVGVAPQLLLQLPAASTAADVSVSSAAGVHTRLVTVTELVPLFAYHQAVCAVFWFNSKRYGL